MTPSLTFTDFPVGALVKVVTPAVDFFRFNGDTGWVTRNTGTYLGITVRFDKARVLLGDSGESNTIQTEFEFDFNPKDLALLDQ